MPEEYKGIDKLVRERQWFDRHLEDLVNSPASPCPGMSGGKIVVPSLEVRRRGRGPRAIRMLEDCMDTMDGEGWRVWGF